MKVLDTIQSVPPTILKAPCRNIAWGLLNCERARNTAWPSRINRSAILVRNNLLPVLLVMREAMLSRLYIALADGSEPYEPGGVLLFEAPFVVGF